MNMPPSSHLLPGTLTALWRVDVKDFYWVPSVTNFPGVDSVLGDSSGNLFTIQAAIADDHTSPTLGIKRVWEQLHPDVRTGRIWHYVIVTTTMVAAKSYVKKFSEELSSFTLGEAHKHITVLPACFRPLRDLTQARVQLVRCAEKYSSLTSYRTSPAPGPVNPEKIYNYDC